MTQAEHLILRYLRHCRCAPCRSEDHPVPRVEDGWLLAAPEIERSVAIATRQILRDQASISTVLQEGRSSTAELSSALKIVEDCCAQLEAHSEIATTISEAIERVDLSKDGIQLTLNLAPLISHRASVPAGARLTITRRVPLQIKRRGVELRLVLKGEANAVRRTDPALLNAISRAHRGSPSSHQDVRHPPLNPRSEKDLTTVMSAVWCDWRFCHPRS